MIVRDHLAGVHHYLVAVLPGICDVIDVAGLGIEPPNRATAAIAWRDPETSRPVLLLNAPQGLLGARFCEDDREMVQEYVVFVQTHVGREPRPGQLETVNIG